MKLFSKTIFALYLLSLIWLVLFKFSFDLSSALDSQTRSLNLIPFADFSGNNLGDVINNFVVFIPFGLLLGINLKRANLWQKLALIFMFSLTAELIQFALAIGATDATDVITNTYGGFLGLLLYDFGKKYVSRRKLDGFVVAANAIALISLFGILFSHTVRFRSGPQTRPLSSQQTVLAKDAQLAWPAVGQAAVGTVEDGVLAHSSDTEKLRPTASMAKVITALAIMEKQPFKPGQEGQTYTITKEDVVNMNTYIAENGSVLPLRIGEELTQYQAMQRMLIASDNNMADILVERRFGSREAYVAYASNMLKRMGLSRTVVTDASGFSPDTASTPSELVAIGIAALKNPVIAEIVAQQQAEIPGVGTITNTNQLLGTDGVIGVKTGTTDQAGSCLLFAARYTVKDGQEKTIVGVIMGDTNHDSLYSDSKKLLASAKQGLDLVEVQSVGNVVAPPAEQRKGRAPR